jgi:hypothetical protein
MDDKEKIKERVKFEIENLKRLNKEMEKILNQIKKKKPQMIEIRAAASVLHDFYSGIEKIFEKIAIYVDGHFPKGANWHIDLLNQMTKKVKNRREAIIDKEFQIS